MFPYILDIGAVGLIFATAASWEVPFGTDPVSGAKRSQHNFSAG